MQRKAAQFKVIQICKSNLACLASTMIRSLHSEEGKIFLELTTMFGRQRKIFGFQQPGKIGIPLKAPQIEPKTMR